MKWKVTYPRNLHEDSKTLSSTAIHGFLDFLLNEGIWFKVEPVLEVEDLD